jgi:hypothetical protein
MHSGVPRRQKKYVPRRSLAISTKTRKPARVYGRVATGSPRADQDRYPLSQLIALGLILPDLGITHRYLGTEPLDLVTNYNAEMKH